jgi:hypothetical protein
MKAYPFLPGVPAAGHVTGGGWWHPGKADGCVKCEPYNPRHRKAPASPTREDKRSDDR